MKYKIKGGDSQTFFFDPGKKNPILNKIRNLRQHATVLVLANQQIQN
jgi:hypothetical protein